MTNITKSLSGDVAETVSLGEKDHKTFLVPILRLQMTLYLASAASSNGSPFAVSDKSRVQRRPPFFLSSKSICSEGRHNFSGKVAKKETVCRVLQSLRQQTAGDSGRCYLRTFFNAKQSRQQNRHRRRRGTGQS